MLEIKEGKLYQDGKEIKPEVGNKEHIELLRQHGTYHHEPELTEEEVKEIEENGIDLEVHTHTETTAFYRASFTCMCGREVTEESEQEDEEYPDAGDLEGDKISCMCGKEYKVTDGGEKVSLIKK